MQHAPVKGAVASAASFINRAIARFHAAPATTQAILFAAAAGFTFSALNMLLRYTSLSMHPFQTQFLRYLMGVVVMLPFMLRAGLSTYRPSDIKGQFSRGLVHSIGLSLWFIALPHLALADMTAIGYTGPIFSMIGAAYLLGEKMRLDRWIAALIGFVGVLIVVGPRLSGNAGWYTVAMLASAPMFSLSFLLTKILTMLGEHSEKLQGNLSADHHVLLDAMCEAMEKTKGKMMTFEKTQNEMQRVLADFQQGKLASHAPGNDTHAIKTRLDTYAKMSKEMDLQFSQALQTQQSKIRELEHKVHSMSSHSQQAKINELEDKLHELSMHQLNHSQQASVIKTTDRDVKLLQHDMRQMHALKDDMQSLAEEHKRSNVKADVADMHAKLHELRREMMLQDVRLDKTHMHIAEMRKKMDM
jgi:uncharacterized membrane protein